MTSLYFSMTAFIAGIKDRLAPEKGATAVEYGLLVALIAAIIVGVVATLGQDVLRGFNIVETALP